MRGASALSDMLRFLTISLCAAAFLPASSLAKPPATGRFAFSGWDGPTLEVFYAEPDPARFPDAPVVIVLHGVDRNADAYRDNWAGPAGALGLRIYAPAFSAEAFPGAAMYNLGGAGTEGPYAFTALEPLFDAIAARGGAPEGYHLFGHSAGAQAVHRAVLLEDLPRLRTAYAANAGWYTFPDPGTPWPYGLGGAPVTEEAERAWLAAPLVILLGEEDDDPEHRHLRRTAEADAQGPNRYARGLNFLDAARTRAAAMDAPLAWRLVTVAGVAHDNAGMAEAAAAHINALAVRPPAQP
ncbi:alpha/beta hydrolase [Marinicauda algicola]|uniref:Alpha/beta hydrolase n=1 Tax=Marinicauda algicola TaxID=2029849 RepID=A0A4S2GXZ9_9PROT|nr:alpha/beta hydrolase [Marinicauda algicola]TGY87751.1 alpha/beta hydrolase [Marinicauda algicola]